MTALKSVTVLRQAVSVSLPEVWVAKIACWPLALWISAHISKVNITAFITHHHHPSALENLTTLLFCLCTVMVLLRVHEFPFCWNFIEISAFWKKIWVSHCRYILFFIPELFSSIIEKLLFTYYWANLDLEYKII